MDLRKLLMNPAFWDSPGGGALMSFGLPMLSQLFGAGNAERDFYNKLSRIGGPEHLFSLIDKNNSLLQHGAAADRAGILSDSLAMGNDLQRSFAQAGQSGVGALAATAASSLAGRDFRRLNAGIRTQANMLGRTDQMNEFNMARGWDQDLLRDWTHSEDRKSVV